MKNKLYRLNRWLDRNEITKFFLLLFSVALFTIPLQFGGFGGLCVSISAITIVCSFVLFRVNIMNDKVNFDRSAYVVPQIGEIVVVKKDFYYDGSFRKFINQSNPSQKPNWWKISKGTELVIIDIEEETADWKIRFFDRSKGDMHLYYLDTKNYWDTKSNIKSNHRDFILKKLGI
jgi:hypothetical protein